MRILVACEFSGRVRDAFIARGHDAISVDLLPSEAPGPHMQDDVLPYLHDGWDMMLAFPPCTALANSGNRWYMDTLARREALDFVRTLLHAPIPCIALENPPGAINSRICQPHQIIQPWQYGHGETKATCLWLKGLPRLTPTNVVAGREQRIWHMAGGKDRARNRSRTYEGIAAAMADQWGIEI